MGSSDHMTTVETTIIDFRPTFTDPWFPSEALSREDTDALAHQTSIRSNDDHHHLLTPFLNTLRDPDTQSGPETASKRHRNSIPVSSPPAAGKASKRKSRASKKRPSQTTFIAADPANFRQMVQQVTGVGFDGPHAQVPASSLGPDLQRALGAGAGGQMSLPTTNSSSILMLEGQVGGVVMQGPVPFAAPQVGGIARGSVGGLGLGFDSVAAAACFPTLDSWKVM